LISGKHPKEYHANWLGTHSHGKKTLTMHTIITKVIKPPAAKIKSRHARQVNTYHACGADGDS